VGIRLKTSESIRQPRVGTDNNALDQIKTFFCSSSLLYSSMHNSSFASNDSVPARVSGASALNGCPAVVHHTSFVCVENSSAFIFSFKIVRTPIVRDDVQ
jgi:hypothetical protein